MTRLYTILIIVSLTIFSFLVWIYYSSDDIDAIKAEYETQMDKYDIYRIENVRKLNDEIMETKQYLNNLRSQRDEIMKDIDTPPADILDPQLYYEVATGSVSE